jgi:hypothetical protein
MRERERESFLCFVFSVDWIQLTHAAQLSLALTCSKLFFFSFLRSTCGQFYTNAHPCRLRLQLRRKREGKNINSLPKRHLPTTFPPPLKRKKKRSSNFLASLLIASVFVLFIFERALNLTCVRLSVSISASLSDSISYVDENSISFIGLLSL